MEEIDVIKAVRVLPDGKFTSAFILNFPVDYILGEFVYAPSGWGALCAFDPTKVARAMEFFNTLNHRLFYAKALLASEKQAFAPQATKGNLMTSRFGSSFVTGCVMYDTIFCSAIKLV